MKGSSKYKEEFMNYTKSIVLCGVFFIYCNICLRREKYFSIQQS